MAQGNREILWVVDERGNHGKSFSRYFRAMYGFMILDGTVTARDVAHMIQGTEKGFCINVNRASLEQFNYSSLEALKNGVLVSGKYAGKTLFFDPVPTVVFCNSFPNMAQLSLDRWRVEVIGEGELSDTSKEPVLIPSGVFPFSTPPPLPSFDEDFNVRE